MCKAYRLLDRKPVYNIYVLLTSLVHWCPVRTNTSNTARASNSCLLQLTSKTKSESDITEILKIVFTVKINQSICLNKKCKCKCCLKCDNVLWSWIFSVLCCILYSISVICLIIVWTLVKKKATSTPKAKKAIKEEVVGKF